MDLGERFRNEKDLRTVQAGEVIFHQGDYGAVMFVLVAGDVDVIVSDEVVERASSGSVIGEMALIAHTTRSATVIARSLCHLVPIDVVRFDDYIREAPDFARFVMKVMADRIRRMNDRLLEAQASAPAQRRKP